VLDRHREGGIVAARRLVGTGADEAAPSSPSSDPQAVRPARRRRGRSSRGTPRRNMAPTVKVT